MAPLRHLLTTHGLDAFIVVAAITAVAEVVSRTDSAAPAGAMLWLEAGALAAVILLLLARQRFPFAAPAALWLLCAILSFVDGRLVVSVGAITLAGIGGAVLLGNLRNGLQARIGLAIVVAGAVLVVHNQPSTAAGEYVSVPLLFAIGWLVGFALRERSEQTEAAEARAAQAEREREATARVAVAEERARIARELHDVVAHAVSVMVLQVGAVRHRMPDGQAEDREALKNVENAGRTALAEMRRLLGAMRHDGEEMDLVPHPGLANLDSLVDDVRAAGLDVRLQIHGEPVALPPSLDLSAYRILQEGLTNTLKHARARQAEVGVHYGADDLLVEVCDDGVGPAASDGMGHGLVGIGERVKIYGGVMSAGRSRTGGFALTARLPLEGR